MTSGSPEPPADIAQPGRWLAHYTSAATAFEYILPTRRLRLSPYRLMRDPVENKDPLIGTAYFSEDVEKPDPARPARSLSEANRQVKNIRDGMRLLSLTRDMDSPPGAFLSLGCCWARPRMWEQYADLHRGVCLVFEQDALIAAVTAELGADKVFTGPVLYTPAGPAQSESRFIVDDRLFDDDQREQAVLDHISKFREDFFFLKNDDYASEREFRMVLAAVEQEYAYAAYGDALQAVIFGEKFPDWQVRGAVEICEGAGAEARKLVWSNGTAFAARGFAETTGGSH
jgi:hypothetical protein